MIGLDLSITATGICDVFGETFTVGGPSDRGDTRIFEIIDRSSDVISLGCDLVVVEGLAVHGHGNGMTAAQLMGALKFVLIGRGVPYAEVPPATLKKFATGRGNADKTAMALAAFKRAGVEFADDNQCDAWWLRQAGLTALGSPEVDLPQAQVDALAKVDWPEVPR